MINPKNTRKSISGLNSLKIPNRRSDKLEISLSKTKKNKEIYLSVNSPVDVLKKHTIKSSISPKANRNLSPLNENKSDTSLNKQFSYIGRHEKLSFLHLDIKKELDLNRHILQNPSSFKPNSCLEDIITLGDLSDFSRFSYLDENLKVCTQIIRNLLCRLEEYGKNNEAVLIDKFWKHVVVTLDRTIDAFVNDKNSQPKMNYSKPPISHAKSDCDLLSRSKRKDYDFESLVKSEGFENLEVVDFGKIVEKVNKDLKKLTEMFSTKTKTLEEVEHEVLINLNVSQAKKIMFKRKI